MSRVMIWTDGACLGNPGPGGWAAIIEVEDQPRHELRGGEFESTNNRMEMSAVIEALQWLPSDGSPHDVCVTTDSQYVIKGMTEWLPGWKRRGWRTASKKPVANQDLWQSLDRQVSAHQVSWSWVRGHTGHPENERCDQLANQAIRELGQDSDAAPGAEPSPLLLLEVSLRSPDPMRLGSFYSEVLGLPRQGRATRASVSLRAAGLKLTITKGDALAQASGLVLKAASHLELTIWKRRLEEHGCDLEEDEHGLKFKDPDGRTVEITTS